MFVEEAYGISLRRAGLIALRRPHETAEVSAHDFEKALGESRASVTPEMEREYQEIKASLGQEAPLRQPIGFRLSSS